MIPFILCREIILDVFIVLPLLLVLFFIFLNFWAKLLQYQLNVYASGKEENYN